MQHTTHNTQYTTRNTPHATRFVHVTIFLTLMLLMTMCGGTPEGDAARGEQLFKGEAALSGGLPACTECHTVVPGETSPSGLGLNLSNVGNRAAQVAAGQTPPQYIVGPGAPDPAAAIIPEQTAEQYLRDSIVNPDAILTGNFQEGIMNRDYGPTLSAQEVSDLVAYMLTLQSGQD
jgi:cytochrome c2